MLNYLCWVSLPRKLYSIRERCLAPQEYITTGSSRLGISESVLTAKSSGVSSQESKRGHCEHYRGSSHSAVFFVANCH